MGDRSARLLCSRSTEPLAAQMAQLRESTGAVNFELQNEVTDGYLAACFDAGLLIEGGYRQRSGEHPAWQAGLAAAGAVLIAGHGALMADAAAAFFAQKQRVLFKLLALFGETVHVPRFFIAHNFAEEGQPKAVGAHYSYRATCKHISSMFGTIHV